MVHKLQFTSSVSTSSSSTDSSSCESNLKGSDVWQWDEYTQTRSFYFIRNMERNWTVVIRLSTYVLLRTWSYCAFQVARLNERLFFLNVQLHRYSENANNVYPLSSAIILTFDSSIKQVK